MEASATRFIHLAFIGVMACVALCILVCPAGLTANDGFSYFGGQSSSLPFYLLGCGLFSLGFGLAALALRGLFRAAFFACALCMIGVAATPYNAPVLGELHELFGAALFILELVTCVALARRAHGKAGWIGLAFMFASGLVCFYYLPMRLGYLLEGQVAFQLAAWFSLAVGLGASARSHQLPEVQPE